MDVDNVLIAIQTRVIRGIQNQDDLWVKSEGQLMSYHRVDTSFKPLGDDKLIIHVWEDEELRSFLVTVTELETE